MSGSVKSGISVAVATTGTSAGTWLEYIPTALGVVGTLVGICLSVVLIYYNIQKNNREKRLLEAQLEQINKRRSDS